MRRALLLIVMFFVSLPAVAQSNDFSFWGRYQDGEFRAAPWYVHSDTLYAEARFGFDWDETGALFIGMPLKKGDLTITPSVGVLGGQFDGSSVQLNFTLNRGRFSGFMLNQYARGSGGSTNFVYHWTTCAWSVTDRVAIGFDEQYFRESGGERFIDVGPLAKVFLGKAYLRLWPTIDPGHTDIRKVFVAAGVVF